MPTRRGVDVVVSVLQLEVRGMRLHLRTMLDAAVRSAVVSHVLAENQSGHRRWARGVCKMNHIHRRRR